MSDNIPLLAAITATAELCGKVYTPVAARMLAQDLDGFDEKAILAALARCRKELNGHCFNAAAVIARIEDGRPGVDEAWAMLPLNEFQTVVWTNEIIVAWAVAKPFIDEGDRLGGRMAFKECYQHAIAEARHQKRPVAWVASIGQDAQARDQVLIAAVEKGRLPASHVAQLLAHREMSQPMQALLSQIRLKRICDNC